MCSINRAPFSSSCINISGDSETNRSAFDLLLATQKRGAALPPSGPSLLSRHRSVHQAMGNTRWQGSHLPAGLVWAGEQGPCLPEAAPPPLAIPRNGRTWSAQSLFLEMLPWLLPKSTQQGGHEAPAQTGSGCRTCENRWPQFWLQTPGTQ